MSGTGQRWKTPGLIESVLGCGGRHARALSMRWSLKSLCGAGGKKVRTAIPRSAKAFPAFTAEARPSPRVVVVAADRHRAHGWRELHLGQHRGARRDPDRPLQFLSKRQSVL